MHTAGLGCIHSNDVHSLGRVSHSISYGTPNMIYHVVFHLNGRWAFLMPCWDTDVLADLPVKKGGLKGVWAKLILCDPVLVCSNHWFLSNLLNSLFWFLLSQALTISLLCSLQNWLNLSFLKIKTSACLLSSGIFVLWIPAYNPQYSVSTCII